MKKSAACKLRKTLKLSREKFARLVDTSTSSVIRWEKEGVKRSSRKRKFLMNLERVVDLMKDSGEKIEAIMNWLNKPDPNFLNMPPIALLRYDQATEKIIEYLKEA